MRKEEFLYMQNSEIKLNNTIINIKDKKNNINPWLITRENANTYQIESKRDRRFFTSIYKNECFMQDGELHCSRIINGTSESKSYAFAPFYSFDLEEESTRESDFNWTESES